MSAPQRALRPEVQRLRDLLVSLSPGEKARFALAFAAGVFTPPAVCVCGHLERFHRRHRPGASGRVACLDCPCAEFKSFYAG